MEFVLLKKPHAKRRVKNPSAYSLIVICLTNAKIMIIF